MRINIQSFTRLKSFSKKEKGSATIIVLALIFLTSAVLLAFVAQSTFERASSHNYAQALRVQEIADSAGVLIIQDVFNEIKDGSDTTGDAANGFTYTPKSRSSILPQVSGITYANAIPNLIKRSDKNASFFTPVGSEISLLKASPSSTTTSSANGRNISLKRWNAPYLMGSTLPAAFTAPDWVFLTRGGPEVLSTLTSPNKDKSFPGSNKFVVGRFAYCVYDEGETLDLNIAGHPRSGMSPTFTGFRRTGAQADLTQIPGINDSVLDKIIAWRNGASTPTFENYVLNNTKGFLEVSPGDDTFLGRLDLIRFWNENGFDKQALTYLGTFSREKNAPSWQPDRNYGGTYNYFNNHNQSSSINRNLPAVKNPTSHPDAGKPMLDKRFLLSRLAWLTPEGPSSGHAADIKTYFGLEWDASNHQWIYKSPKGSAAANSIKKLSEIDGTRTNGPDFFELLQATILDGSLGKSAGVGTVLANCDPPDSRGDYQIMRIAANIIDQYDNDSFPTTINYDGQEFYGTENLPYLNEVFIKFFNQNFPPPPSPADPDRKISPYLFFEFWNPHSQSDSGAVVASQIPDQVRLRIISGAFRAEGGVGAAITPFVFNNATAPVATLNKSDFSLYNEPHVPTSPAVFPGLNYAGVNIGNPGQFPRNEILYGWWFMHIDSAAMMVMEYKDSGGVFRPYSTFTGLKTVPITGIIETTSQIWTDGEPEINQSMPSPLTYYYDSERADDFDSINPGRHSILKSDPRTPRFGASVSSRRRAWGPDPYLNNKYDNSLRPRRTAGALPPEGIVAQYARPSWFPGNNINFYPAMMAQNTIAGQTYSDRDGVTRRGDYATSPNSFADVNPFETISGAPRNEDKNCRPVILNRPFRSVAELGYVFRDMPWKTLDFSSADSADLGLLDVFTLDEAPLIAGKVSVNTRNKPVLQALLNGSAKTTLGSSLSNPVEVANQIISYTGARSQTLPLPADASVSGPIINKSQLGAYIVSKLNISNSEENLIKIQREASIRALNDVTQTRTWNLLIDVIAQAGNYPTAASSLDQFNVEGEQRLWIHVAIDRFTGEVIDQQTEIVHE